MGITEIYFSPTGSTKKVVEKAEKVWKDIDQIIDLCENIEEIHLKDTLAIIAAPAYGGRAPKIMVERLKKVYAKNSKAIIITSYGNREYDNTLDELNDVCTKQGFEVVAAIAAVCEHSIVPKYGAKRPDEKDDEQLVSFFHTIKEAIESKHLQVLSYRDASEWREFNGVPLQPKTSNKCNACGLCASQCPVSAIDKSNPKITDAKKCITCMRCIAICPNSAKSLNTLMVTALSKKLEKACSIRKENELFIQK